LETGQDTYDPDVDLVIRPETVPPGVRLGDYQRLFANPLLALLIWIVAAAVIRAAVMSRNLAQFFAGVVLLFVAPLFIQFHCLDCRATGWLIRYRRHGCPAVVNRWKSGGDVQWPRLKVQLAVWVAALAAASILGLILMQRFY
jgi:hypothetical protein